MHATINPISNIPAIINSAIISVMNIVVYVDDPLDAEIVAAVLVKPNQLPDVAIWLEGHGQVVGIGSAFADADLRAALLAGLHSVNVDIIEPALPQATALLAIAQRLTRRLGDAATHHPRDAAPIYLRNNVAMTIDERRQFHAAKQQAHLDAA